MAYTFESVWEYREDSLYPELFGPVSRGIFVLEASDFAHFGAGSPDPRWLHLGVFEFAPTASRPTWLYVTSGGSTPWEEDTDESDADAYSWLGIELMMETPRQADWPIIALRRMLAFHVLAAHGHFGDRPGLDYGVRVPMGGPIDGGHSALAFLAAALPEGVAATQRLPSGRFDLLHFVGITREELDFAKAQGTEALIARLRDAGAFPATDPDRASILAEGRAP